MAYNDNIEDINDINLYSCIENAKVPNYDGYEEKKTCV